MLAAAVVLALAVAESRAFFYSFTRRDHGHTVQGLLLAERHNLTGKRVFQDTWTRADRVVLEHVAGASAHEANDVEEFLRTARPDDYVIVAHADGNAPEIIPVRRNRRHVLCRLRK